MTGNIHNRPQLELSDRNTLGLQSNYLKFKYVSKSADIFVPAR